MTQSNLQTEHLGDERGTTGHRCYICDRPMGEGTLDAERDTLHGGRKNEKRDTGFHEHLKYREMPYLARLFEAVFPYRDEETDEVEFQGSWIKQEVVEEDVCKPCVGKMTIAYPKDKSVRARRAAPVLPFHLDWVKKFAQAIPTTKSNGGISVEFTNPNWKEDLDGWICENWNHLYWGVFDILDPELSFVIDVSDPASDFDQLNLVLRYVQNNRDPSPTERGLFRAYLYSFNLKLIEKLNELFRAAKVEEIDGPEDEKRELTKQILRHVTWEQIEDKFGSGDLVKSFVNEAREYFAIIGDKVALEYVPGTKAKAVSIPAGIEPPDLVFRVFHGSPSLTRVEFADRLTQTFRENPVLQKPLQSAEGSWGEGIATQLVNDLVSDVIHNNSRFARAYYHAERDTIFCHRRIHLYNEFPVGEHMCYKDFVGSDILSITPDGKDKFRVSFAHNGRQWDELLWDIGYKSQGTKDELARILERTEVDIFCTVRYYPSLSPNNSAIELFQHYSARATFQPSAQGKDEEWEVS